MWNALLWACLPVPTCFGKQFATPSQEATDLGFSLEHHRRLSLGKGQSFRLVNSGKPQVHQRARFMMGFQYLTKLRWNTVKLAVIALQLIWWAMEVVITWLPLCSTKTSNLLCISLGSSGVMAPPGAEYIEAASEEVSSSSHPPGHNFCADFV